MKSLRHYLAESIRTYHYTIKIAGEVDQKSLDMFRHNLSKFDPISIGEPKTTPIQKNPYGFPDAENESVTIIKAEFKYPANEPMIQQVAQLCGFRPFRVRAIDTKFNDEEVKEIEHFENQKESSPLLMHTELSDNGKEASKEYANQYLDRVTTKSDIDIPYAAKKTPTAPNKSKEGINTQSPMSKMTRPERPATGSRGASK